MAAVTAAAPAGESGTYDAIIVGTGFASSFFLAEYLKQARPTERFLVLERGFCDSHRWQVKERK